MTGSRAQWYNGMVLLVVFFSCRLIWGTWQSSLVYRDMWAALKQTWAARAAGEPVNISAEVFRDRSNVLCFDKGCAQANAEVYKFGRYTAGGIPVWLPMAYVASNIVLNSLNYYWFLKMIDAVLKRFRNRGPEVKEKPAEELKETVTEAASYLEKKEGAFVDGPDSKDGNEEVKVTSSGAEAGKELRNRKIEVTPAASS